FEQPHDDMVTKGLDQLEATFLEGELHPLVDIRVRDGIANVVGLGGGFHIDAEFKIDSKALAEIVLLKHHTVIAVECESCENDLVAVRVCAHVVSSSSGAP